jgi:hypothetical protein
MAAVATIECTCPSAPVLCAKCGGLLRQSAEPIAGLLSKIEGENLAWVAELNSEHRLNSTLATFRAIDRQYKIGAPIASALSQAMKEISLGISEIKKEVVNDVVERFSQMQSQNQSEAAQLREVIREIVAQQTQDVMNQVRILQEQGKSVAEIHGLLKEAVGSMQTVMTAFQIPTAKGEETELLSMKNLQEAFFGVPGVKIDPLGGPDATDAIVSFLQSGLAIGRTLVEVKSRKTWNNAFLDQVHSDMERYDIPMAVIVTDKLPRNAKGKGFAIDSEVGLIVVTTQDLLIPTIGVFREIHSLAFKMQKKALDIRSLTGNKDLIHYVNDNMRILDDCKKILDAMDDAARKVKEHVAAISSRLQDNNGKIAHLFSEFSESSQPQAGCQAISETQEALGVIRP